MNINRFKKMSDFLTWNFNNPASANVKAAFEQYYSRYVDNSKMKYVWEHYDRRSILLKRKSKIGKNVLEIGSSCGMNSIYAAMNGANVVGLEVKQFDVEVATEQLRYIESIIGKKLSCVFIRSDITKFVPQFKFDVIFMQETFHHLEPREEVVSWLKTNLNPEGIIIFEESNALNPFIQFFLFKVRGFNTIKIKIDKDSGERYIYGNERILTPNRIRRLFHQTGWFVSKPEYFRCLPTKISSFGLISKIAKIMESYEFLQHIFPFIFLHYEITVVKSTNVLEKKSIP